MGDEEKIIIKRWVIGSAITLFVGLMGSTWVIVKNIGAATVEAAKYYQRNEDQKQDFDRRINANSAAITDQQKEISEMSKMVEKHETFFDYMANKPASHFKSFALNNK